MLKRPSNFAF